jgi:hypothetical protein
VSRFFSRGHIDNWSSSTAEDNIRIEYQGRAYQALQKECAMNCASYGVTLSNLIGPKLDYGTHTRYQDHYIFSWHSNNSSVKLTINMDSPPESTTINWSKG